MTRTTDVAHDTYAHEAHAGTWREETEEWTRELSAAEFAWKPIAAAHVRFRRVAVELFSELNDLSTIETSPEGVVDMIRSCSWVCTRSTALQKRLQQRLDDATLVGTFEPDLALKAGGFEQRPGERSVGKAQIPAWAVARFVQAGLDADQVAALWRGELTTDDVKEAIELVDTDPTVMDNLPSDE